MKKDRKVREEHDTVPAADYSRLFGECHSREVMLRAMLDGSHSLLVLLDCHGVVIDANYVALAFVGASIEQVVGVHFEDTEWCNQDADQSDHLREAIHRAADGELVHIDLAHCGRRGDVRLLEVALVPLRDKFGAIVWLVSEAHDVTEIRRLQAERSDLEQRLRHSERLECVGRLAAGVAHDFNNLLTVIQCGLDALLTEEGHERHNLEIFDDMNEATRGASALAHQLLAFSRKNVSAPEDFVVDERAQSIANMWRRAIGDTIVLTVDLNAPGSNVRMSKGHFEQILVNLIVNARDAMPKGGKMTLRTECMSFDSLPPHAIGKGGTRGLHVVTTVTDTGCGMSADTLHKAFDPFFTTKSKGTGFGLATVYGLVTQGGGFVTLQSTPGEGTCVDICLPLVEADQVVTLAPRSGDRFFSTVLLVDNDVAVLEGELRILEQLGCEVVAVHSSQAALLELSKRSDIDILMTEVVTSEMTGVQLAELARRVQPDMRVVFVSGLATEQDVSQWIHTGQASLLAKPLTLGDVTEVLRHESDAWRRATA